MMLSFTAKEIFISGGRRCRAWGKWVDIKAHKIFHLPPYKLQLLHYTNIHQITHRRRELTIGVCKLLNLN